MKLLDKISEARHKAAHKFAQPLTYMHTGTHGVICWIEAQEGHGVAAMLFGLLGVVIIIAMVVGEDIK